ncbi:HU family DNA-binding protein [Deinococcus soli (ex Cha et al. 2016)]|uniref:DNA-binding protein HU-beta n=2 Tax=Deinococcus soli (ex Cha et al. 2016) TaxID=1309411 RepID=A0AAE3XBL5_9DEIO|nr:HU family DNA-binding protein [Deinococcus soli (ex Cha et al. 2016)]MDR6218291.1 DNA-binding protein HU-beta [Deinococcus soli (ex Cha et al. 2016)]MDR6329031.1 DNA-binding protein HU-beta [Deinococcus soli (ex Cha et al. 2016)]MDR6751304.1 DNA-binding protein HU-beta [Deinococcus soli (ex Cha et al. 2016)]
MTKSSKIGKKELVNILVEKGLNKKDAGTAIDALADAILDAARQGVTVSVPNLGTFKRKDTAARQGVRPGTTEKIEIPAGKKLSFKASSAIDLG